MGKKSIRYPKLKYYASESKTERKALQVCGSISRDITTPSETPAILAPRSRSGIKGDAGKAASPSETEPLLTVSDDGSNFGKQQSIPPGDLKIQEIG